MKITIEVPDPAPPQVVAAVTALITAAGTHGTVTTDAEWTVERAMRLLRDTNSRTVLFIEAAVEGEGWVDGPAFRAQWGESALRGPSQSITKAIRRGAEQGHWSPTITPPFTPTAPDKEGWSKTGGYYLADGLVPIFREALAAWKKENEKKGAAT
ncbi:hypothetical protein KUF83_30445 [Streptomyces sp. BV286]|uniref:hypothetical protein n=1 Tax=Streptomyces sp. BV286 TaxID=2849672 RepID=UPI001C2E6F80|nr:hypothetical protein [Streptomyces sp. BV286]MBV1940857.1 hypothetical protein [Streptomyces sp. BV286]